MTRCWEWRAAERPDFAAIHERVEGLYLAADERGVREAENAAAAAAVSAIKADEVQLTAEDEQQTSPSPEPQQDEARKRRQHQQEMRRQRHRQHIEGAITAASAALAANGDNDCGASSVSSSNASSSYFSATDEAEESSRATRLRPGVLPASADGKQSDLLVTELFQTLRAKSLLDSPEKTNKEVFTMGTMERKPSLEDLNAGSQHISSLRKLWEPQSGRQMALNVDAAPEVPRKTPMLPSYVKPPSSATLARARAVRVLSEKPHTYAAPGAAKPATKEALLAAAADVEAALSELVRGGRVGHHDNLLASKMRRASERVSSLADAFSTFMDRVEEGHAESQAATDGFFGARAMLARLREVAGRLSAVDKPSDLEKCERTLDLAKKAVAELATLVKRT
jgi:hypothetical protein